MNSQRLRLAAVSAAASRSRLSRRFIPRATMANLWMGLKPRPGTLSGASCTESAPRSAMSRSARNGITDASQPDISRVGPSSARRAQRTRAEQQRIAGTQRDPGLLLPRLDVLAIQFRAGLQIGHPLQPGHIDEDAPRHQAVLHRGRTHPRTTVLRDDLREVEAVVDLVFVEDMTESIQMRERHAVKIDVDSIAGVLRLGKLTLICKTYGSVTSTASSVIRS